ncbi:hypothetical protein GE061_001091 [Apolygus lucorum]|uniref:Reverse transcriptase n=1 Tax=Apolygus lucorum TaxID=248454 RepID=A0A6A4KMX5_APOLU|nr:hypothetical protein GE061_001091 [Apolygus lucorum]
MIQSCPVTRNARCHRHDAVVDLIAECLKRKEWQTRKELHIVGLERSYQPDLVVVKEGRSFIIDVAITTDSDASPMASVHRMKTIKYSVPAVMEAVKAVMNTETVEVLPAVMTWQGVWHKVAATALKKIYPDFLLGWAARRAIDGSGFIWATYMRTPTMRARSEPS